MKVGATISGGLHMGLLVLVAFGVDWSPRDEVPFTVTEIELVDGTDFDAALSTAPVVQSEGPAELKPPSDTTDAPANVQEPDSVPEEAEIAELEAVDTPAPRPSEPVVQFAPPPVNVPTEPPRQSIAELPSPDELDRQSTEPESPASTEPLQPLATIQPPVPGAKPAPPPEPEPEPEQAEPEQVPQEETPEAVAEKQPEPEPQQDPEPVAEVEQQPEAPEGPAPQTAALPIAKPADLAAAALAAARKEAALAAEKKAEEDAKRAKAEAERREKARIAAANKKKTEQKKPASQAKKPAGGSSAVKAARLNRGERDALRLGIKKYYVYNGDRSDRSLQVIIRVRLKADGTLNGNPVQRSAQGGNAGSQKALFDAGRRAIIRAARAGEFKRLPRDKYPRWKTLNFRFSIDGVGRVSS